MSKTVKDPKILDLSGQKLTTVTPDPDIRPDVIIVDNNEVSRIENLERYATHLERLSVANNKLTSMAGVQRLHNLTKLARELSSDHCSVLNLPSNNLVSIEGLRDLHRLVWLNLSANQISRIDSLNSNLGLKHLDLSDNQISRLAEMSFLRHLRTLLLHGNQIESLQQAGLLLPKSLVILSLAENRIFDLIQVKYLRELSQLEQLSVMRNPCITSAGEDWLGYRPYVVGCCSRKLCILDGEHVSDRERLRGEWLFSMGRVRQFKVGQHAELVDYLQKVSKTDDEQNLRKVLDQQRILQKPRPQVQDDSVGSPVTCTSPERLHLGASPAVNPAEELLVSPRSPQLMRRSAPQSPAKESPAAVGSLVRVRPLNGTPQETPCNGASPGLPSTENDLEDEVVEDDDANQRTPSLSEIDAIIKRYSVLGDGESDKKVSSPAMMQVSEHEQLAVGHHMDQFLEEALAKHRLQQSPEYKTLSPSPRQKRTRALSAGDQLESTVAAPATVSDGRNSKFEEYDSRPVRPLDKHTMIDVYGIDPEVAELEKQAMAKRYQKIFAERRQQERHSTGAGSVGTSSATKRKAGSKSKGASMATARRNLWATTAGGPSKTYMSSASGRGVAGLSAVRRHGAVERTRFTPKKNTAAVAVAESTGQRIDGGSSPKKRPRARPQHSHNQPASSGGWVPPLSVSQLETAVTAQADLSRKSSRNAALSSLDRFSPSKYLTAYPNVNQLPDAERVSRLRVLHNAATKIAAAWRGYRVRNLDASVQSKYELLRVHRLQDYVQLLMDDRERLRVSAQQEAQIRRVQLQLMSQFWQQVRSIQSQVGSAPLSPSQATTSPSTTAPPAPAQAVCRNCEQLADTCQQLQTQVRRLEKELISVKSFISSCFGTAKDPPAASAPASQTTPSKKPSSPTGKTKETKPSTNHPMSPLALCSTTSPNRRVTGQPAGGPVGLRPSEYTPKRAADCPISDIVKPSEKPAPAEILIDVPPAEESPSDQSCQPNKRNDNDDDNNDEDASLVSESLATTAPTTITATTPVSSQLLSTLSETLPVPVHQDQLQLDVGGPSTSNPAGPVLTPARSVSPSLMSPAAKKDARHDLLKSYSSAELESLMATMASLNLETPRTQLFGRANVASSSLIANTSIDL